MSDRRISVVIPYRERAANLRLALSALAEQTLPMTDFEVVLGVLDDSGEHAAICREFTGRLDVVTVTSSRPWQVGEARNLALRQATGEIVVLMDVDMVLPPRSLQDLYDHHFRYGQQSCVVGQMLDYDNNSGDVTEIDVQPWEHYRKLLADLEITGPGEQDPRMTVPHVIPWAFAWTALIALPRKLAAEFDPGFHGYGVEDLEWAYRVARSGTPILMGRDFFGVHLPHVRSVAANKRSEAPNYRYFLHKWPGLDVELACAFGDFEANTLFPELLRETGGGTLHAVLTDGELDLGVPPGPETLPLLGLALPFEDGSIGSCRVRDTITALPARYRDRILAEVRRVTRP
ncbi:MAG TPA: glycosyltransferase family 2 protein [Actinoplanes sp.]|nr:glycosyltransferase family 2 protein [Actinoplanes sp.]